MREVAHTTIKVGQSTRSSTIATSASTLEQLARAQEMTDLVDDADPFAVDWDELDDGPSGDEGDDVYSQANSGGADSGDMLMMEAAALRTSDDEPLSVLELGPDEVSLTAEPESREVLAVKAVEARLVAAREEDRLASAAQQHYGKGSIGHVHHAIQARSAAEVDAARRREASNPMRLATVLRTSIFSCTDQMVEGSGGPSTVPNLRGLWSNTVLTKVFERYSRICKGFRGMTFQDLVCFNVDMALAGTHVPLEEGSGEPDGSYVQRLSPTSLVKAIPLGLGYRQDVLNRAFADEQDKNDFDKLMTADGARDTGTAPPSSTRHSSFVGSRGEDIFLNFTQFYHIVVYMADVVYPSLSRSSSSAQQLRAASDGHTESGLRAVAVEKLVQEAVVPLYTWSLANFIEGCVDPLLTDRRVGLILNVYAPNLWRLFTTYGQFRGSIRATLPRIAYPSGAKCSERAQFGVPDSAPFSRQDCIAADPDFAAKAAEINALAGDNPGTTDRIVLNCAFTMPVTKLNNEGVVLSEAQTLRIFQDFGVVPNLLSKHDLRVLFRKCCGPKSERPMGAGSPSAATQRMTSPQKKKGRGAVPLAGTFASPSHPLYGKRANKGTPKLASPASSVASPTSSCLCPAAGSPPLVGLAFSEFLELLAASAVKALSSPEYNTMFPNAYSKVLGLLTVWGFADLSRLEDVNLMNADSFLHDS